MQKTVQYSTKYIINGKEYDKVEDVPESHRKFLVDANNNGIPDCVEHLIKVPNATVTEVKHERVFLDEGGQILGAPVQFGNIFASNMNASNRPSSFNFRAFFAVIGIGAFLAALLWVLLSR